MRDYGDLIGKKFGRITIIERFYGEMSRKDRFWVGLCDCGNKTKPIPTRHLRGAKTLSCGCLHKERCTKHGRWDTPEYRVWANIKKRCYNIKCPEYNNYGGRGITMCESWFNSFENFFKDVGIRPSPKHTLDRTNNDGNYEPNNFRWVISFIQHRNKRNNNWVEYKGEMIIITDLASKLNVDVATIRYHLKTKTIDEMTEHFALYKKQSKYKIIKE